VLAGLALFYVGAVLCLNGLWVLGRIGDKEIAVIDIFVGGITLWWPLISHSVRVLTCVGQGVCVFASVHIHPTSGLR